MKKTIEKKRYPLSVPIDLWNKFDKINKDNFRSSNSSMNMLIEDYVKRNKK